MLAFIATFFFQTNISEKINSKKSAVIHQDDNMIADPPETFNGISVEKNELQKQKNFNALYSTPGTD